MTRALGWRAAYGIAALLVLVFFYPLVFGKVFLSPDSVAPAGFSKIAMQALTERGVYALWNPYHFLGMPSFGSLAHVPYVYPLDWIFGFLNQTLGFPDLTWLLAHYLLLALGAVALLRSLGASPEAAALGATTLALTPNLVAVGAFGHGSQIMTAAYLPLLFLLFDRFARRGSLLALAGFALAAALQLLRGHVQIVFYTWLALAGYALFLAVAALREKRRAEAARAVGGLAAGLALGFGMSAFLYLPIRSYAALSVRSAGEGGGAGFEYATSWSFHPAEMLTFVVPSMFGFGGPTYWGTMPFTDYPNYMGIVPFALAVYGAVRTRGLWRLFLVALAGVSLLISFGKHFAPLYALLYDHLPFFNKFRVPVMILVLVQFATASLAALGLDRALREPAPGRKGAAAAAAAAKAEARPWWRGAGLAAAGGVAGLAVLQALRPSLETAAAGSRPSMNAALASRALDMASLDVVKSGFLLAAACAVVAFHRQGRLARSAAAIALLVLTAGDLWGLDRKIMDPQVGSAREYDEHFAETPEVTFLRSDSTQFRVLPLQWNDARLASFGVASLLGYHPAKPRLYQAFMDTVGIRGLGTLQLLNTKYVLTDGYYPPDAGGLVLRQDGPVKVYEVQGALPRAFMVHRVVPLQSETMALSFLHTAGFDPSREALWAMPGPLPALAEPHAPDSVRIERFDFNDVTIRVATAAPGLLVTVDQWDPDWHVTVNGAPAALARVNYLMRGVLLQPGVHEVRFHYMPRALEAGIRLSAAAFVATLLLAIAGVVAARRRRGAAPPAPAPPGPSTERPKR
ncbi:MAG TPA: YfhO family protein [Candidatus Eisenbacteria bacterium]|nr:YfhO family protein [Candidatus Eisenbacteria bacterium]